MVGVVRVLDRSPVASVRRPQTSGESPRLRLDRAEALALLSAAEASGARDHVLACLLTLNGLRVSEACSARAEYLSVERGHHVLTIVGKGKRRAQIALAPRTVDALDAYLQYRTYGPLLFAGDGSPLDRHDAARIVRRLARVAGLTKRISPHSLRHTAVTLALDAESPHDAPLRPGARFARSSRHLRRRPLSGERVVRQAEA